MKSKEYIFDCIKSNMEITADFETLGVVNLKDVNVKHLIFKDCTFNDRFLLEEIAGVINIEFNNCIFNELFELENIEASAILFDNCELVKWIELDKLRCSIFRFEDCQLKSSLTLNDVEIDYLSFVAEETSCEGAIIINSPNQKEVSFTSSKNAHFRAIRVEQFEKIDIDANVNELDIEATSFKSVTISSTKETNTIEQIRIEDIYYEGNIVFEDVAIGQMSIANAFCNKGMLTIAYSSITHLEVQNCQIDHVLLNQVKFIQPPELLGSNLKAWKLSNVIWTDKRRSLKDSYLKKQVFPCYFLSNKILPTKLKYDEDDLSVIKDHIETYRQLKVSSINNHNQIDALLFYRNEMRLYWKLVRIEGGIPLYDRFLIFLNRIVSDFGQNWVMPVIWLFSLTFFNYYFKESPVLSWNINDWCNGFFEMLSYLNPFKLKIDGVSKVVIGMDFLFKAVAGYFIYHFIKASRRFGRI